VGEARSSRRRGATRRASKAHPALKRRNSKWPKDPTPDTSAKVSGWCGGSYPDQEIVIFRTAEKLFPFRWTVDEFKAFAAWVEERASGLK
jgi:hypothetical protein